MFVASLFIPRWRKERILLGSILLLTFPLVVAAAEIGGKPERVDVTVAYVSPSAAFTPLFVASEAGLFTKYGLKAKVQIFGITVALKGLLSEEVDFDVNGSIVSARLGGAPVKYFGAHLQHYVFQMWGAKGITRIEQLKGKTVAVQHAARCHRYPNAGGAQEIWLDSRFRMLNLCTTIKFLLY